MQKWNINIFTWGFTLFLAFVLVYHNRYFYHDDAYITLRYAKNIILGNGAVWNPGEFVQGYTNFLHLMLISILGWLGIDLVLASRIIGFGSLIGLLGVLSLFYKINTSESSQPFKHTPVILVMTASPILIWSIGGLESSLFSFLIAGGTLLFLLAIQAKAKITLYFTSGIVGGLCFLVRPDGIIFISVSSAWLSWLILKNKSKSYSNLLVYLTGVLLLVVPYLIWQLNYYGDIVPNTFYAKTGAPIAVRLNSGIHYLYDYLCTPPFLPILLLVSLFCTIKMRIWNQYLSILGLMVSLYMAFIVWIGGDHMQAYRFIVPIIPLMSVMLTMSLNDLIKSSFIIENKLLIIAILILSSMQYKYAILNPVIEDPACRVGTAIGKYIDQAWASGSLVALNTAGSTPYYADKLKYIDMLGLNDPVISKRKITEIQAPWQRIPGHLKGDGQYVLSRKPDYIIIGPAEGGLVSKPWFLSDFEINKDPQFLNNYTLNIVEFNSKTIKGDDKIYKFTFYQRINRGVTNRKTPLQRLVR